MNKRLFWRACFLGLLLVVLSTSVALASSLQQTDEPGLEATASLIQNETGTPLRSYLPTPSPTSTLEGGNTATLPPAAATPLPTTTLSPPPIGGGRVSVEVLYVRKEPLFGTLIIGSLFYNDIVLPIGRNADGEWVAVQWKEDVGWLWSSLVIWDPGLDVSALTVLSPQTGAPDTGTGSPTALIPTTSPTSAPTLTATLTPTALPSPTLTATPQPSVTALPPPPPTPTPPILPEEIWAPLRSGLLVGGSIILLGLIVYVWRRAAGTHEVRRYARGFPFDVCPVCREGRLQLDENVLYAMGIPTVRRSVRCGNCRSVLREIRPGRWRYTIDPFVNPTMALRYKTRWLSRSDLNALMADVVEIRQIAEEEPVSAEPIDSDFSGFDEELLVDEGEVSNPAEETFEEPPDSPDVRPDEPGG